MTQTFLALITFLFPLAYSPGPGNVFFAANGAYFGFKATIPANAGYHLATFAITAAIGFGFVAAMDQVPQIFVAMKLAGSAYVLWLAWKLFTADALNNRQTARPATLWDGIILLALNPKAYVIIALMFTQFLTSDTNNQTGTVLFITAVFTLNNLIAFSLWALLGDRIAKVFHSPDSARTLNWAFGAILAAVALWMLIA